MRARDQSLSETGYGKEASALLVMWGARALYVGPAFGLTPHRNAVAVLALGIGAPFGVARDPLDLSKGYRSCRTALIAPNRLQHLQITGLMAFLYLDPLSRDYGAVRQRFEQLDDGIAFDLGSETSVISSIRKLNSGAKPWIEAEQELLQTLGLQFSPTIDRRIVRAIASLRVDASSETDAANLARAAGLSASRFLHLFKEATGVPFRRYRTWCRMGAIVRAAASGASLTGAAHAAGLASSAHLSVAFRDMFGLAPSDLGLQKLQLIEAE